MKIAVGVTGASGTIYAERLIRYLLGGEAGGLIGGSVEQVAVIVTQSGRAVADFEREEFLPWLEQLKAGGRIVEYANDDFFTPVASGSGGYDALIVAPCSMGMVGKIAGGVADDLISRAADVMLKEETKRLVICPRETPFSLIHLRNLSTIREAGGIVVPAIPAFYRRPGSIEELVDSVVVRLLAQVGLCPAGYRGWQEE